MSNASIRLYTDDTTDCASDTSPMAPECTMNLDFDCLSGWFESNYLKINAEKAKVMANGP